uniref:Uncharacterized protein n=1 Tax=Meloidogyne incognita TaxID=6306 RepID=A0A914MQ28_MELIC
MVSLNKIVEHIRPSRWTPKSTKSVLIGPRYSPLKIENRRGDFLDKKVYANDSSFERTRRAELNDSKIDVIGRVL